MAWTRDSNGWTILSPVTGSVDAADDSRIFYVDTVGGSASPATAYYAADDAAVGGDPRAPVGSVAAYDSFDTAYAQTRSGKPDWIVLKRGTTVTTAGQSVKSGVSNAAPWVISWYGDEADDRPVMESTANPPDSIIRMGQGGGQDFAAVVGIKFNNPFGDPNDASFDRTIDSNAAIRVIGLGESLLIEDCRCDYCGISVQAYTESVGRNDLTDFELRRTTVYHNWQADGSGSHRQGLFMSENADGRFVNSPLIEDCVFDWNGIKWGASDLEANAQGTVFNRNLYLSQCGPGFDIRGLLSYRSGSTGIQIRNGGTITSSICGRSGDGITMGHPELDDNDASRTASGTISDCYVFGIEVSTSQSATDTFGSGIGISDNSDGVTVTRNIVAVNIDDSQSMNQASGIWVSNESTGQVVDNITISDNIVADWSTSGTAPDGHCLLIGYSIDGNSLTVSGNDFQQVNVARRIVEVDSDPKSVGWTFENNRYFAGSTTAAERFRRDIKGTPTSMTYAEWVTWSGETGSSEAEVTYTDFGRNLPDYMTSIGFGGAGSEQDFIDRAAANRYGSWDSRFTVYPALNYVRAGYDLDPVSVPYQNYLAISAGGSFLVLST